MMSESPSYSYSFSSSPSEDSEVQREAMWSQIARIPIDLLERTDDFMYIEKVLSLVSKYDFTLDDPHMRNPENTTRLARLLKLVSAQCAKKVKSLTTERKADAEKAAETEAFLRKKIELQQAELARIRPKDSNPTDTAAGSTGSLGDKEKPSETGNTLFPSDDEVRQLKVENDTLSAEVRKLTRANNELRESLEARRREQSQSYGDADKLYLEYKHIVARHRRLLEKSQKTEELLSELRSKEKTRHRDTDSELERLRDKVKQLQQENLTLIDSRDHAEELCEKREAEAFRDMTELRRLTKELVEEERSKVRQVREEYASLREEADAHIEELLQQHDEDLRSKDDAIALLRRQLEAATSAQPRRRFNDESSTAASDANGYESESSGGTNSSGSGTHSSTTSSHGRKGRPAAAKAAKGPVSSAVQRRLERENDDLQAEVEELQVRVDAMEEENKRLTRLVKDYESGDEGLSHLRHELGDATRTVEVLQDENAQLRERLNGMEDSLAFTAALQELCKRMGVTEEEISSLKPQNAAAYSEMDTLKEELNVLKEEVEWLEKERRLWMNKVRLQPLMDTKLRFELGLTSEQLRQLDSLVDQMKAGNLVVEDDDKSYKERYFRELEARRKDAAQFNDFVKDRIEDALKTAFSQEISAAGEGDSVPALTMLRDHIDLLTTAAGGDSGEGRGGADVTAVVELTRRQLKEQLESTRRQMDQMSLAAKDSTETIAQLREKLAAMGAEVEMIAKERDQFREAIFAAAGARVPGTPDGFSPTRDQRGGAAGGDPSMEAVQDESQAEDGSTVPVLGQPPGSPSKWTIVANALRIQLKSKEELAQTLTERLADAQKKLDQHKAEACDWANKASEEKRVQEELRDQLSALQEISEDLNAKNRELQSINNDLAKGLHGLDEGSKTKELLQKVVLLRRREGKLLNRLRRAITTQEQAAASEKKMRLKVDHTLASLKEALEGSSSGFVLPPSSASHNFEEEQLDHLHESVSSLLKGKLFREDSRYLVHLQQVYQVMESNEEMTVLRLREKDHLKRIDSLQAEIDRLKTAAIEREHQQEQPRQTDSGSAAGDAAAAPFATSSSNGGGAAAAASKWESESVMWRQKYELCYKRLEAKEGEVALLEKELDSARQEIVDVKDHVRNILSEDSLKPHKKFTGTGESADGSADAAEQKRAGANRDVLNAGRLARYEREVARLKSINLGLLQHTLDLQGDVKSLEVDLEASRQELSLLKESGSSHVINDFVSAAVREHAALRRQSELALLQTRRLRIQLAATEANYQVVANEATAYKLSAYRLYRRYVDEMVGIVDYVRCVQRASKGALSAHRAEIMDRRFQRLAQELEDALRRNKALAADLAESTTVTETLEHQLRLQRLPRGSPERQDALESRLREARAGAREAARQITECREDEKHAESKARRLEVYVQQLHDEITRLEFGSLSAMSPLDEELLQSLIHLKETVFAKAEAPPLAISAAGNVSDGGAPGSQPPAGSSRRPLFASSLTCDDSDIAVREYKAAVMKQRELASQCEGLRRDLSGKTREAERCAAVVADQRDMIQRLEEKSAFYQQQLDDERSKAEARENRIKRAHETQAEVGRRAMEHNAQCLREMVQKKEAEIAQLREQLNAERQRYMEQQLEEAARMERVHEGMFRENNAMVERFKNAINSVGDSLLSIKPPLPGDALDTDNAANASILEQLRYLTAETIRLQRELEASRATNIALETQLSQQVSEAQRYLRFPAAPMHDSSSTAPQQEHTQSTHLSAAHPADAPVPPPQSQPVLVGPSPSAPAAVVAAPTATSPTPVPASWPAAAAGPATAHSPLPAPTHPGSGGASAAATGSNSSNVDALTSIIKSQSAMIESLRQREAAISSELQWARQQHTEAEKALQELRLRHIEKDGALQFVSQVANTASDSAPTRELRAQLAYAEQELKATREQLEQERSAARRLQSDANSWKEHLDQLNLQVANQQVEVDRARSLASLNEGLQSDLNALKDQNDKLVVASSLLKQRLLDEARRGGEASRQHQHEIALAQRMGSLQQESSAHVKALDHRIKEIQKELNARASKEAEMLSKNEELQRMVYQLHQQLRAKDREVEDAKSRAAGGTGGRPSSPPGNLSRGPRGEKGTQMLSSIAPHEQPGSRVFTAASQKPLSSTPPPPPRQTPAKTVGPTAADSGRLAASPQESADRPPPTAVEAAATEGLAASAAVTMAAVNREVHRTQRDNLQQISLLRSTVGRLEKDIAEAREQLKGERDAARSLRTQLQSARRAAEEAETRHAREIAEAHRHKAAAEAALSRQRERAGKGVTGTASTSHAPSSPPPAPGTPSADVVNDLRRQIAELEPKAAQAERLGQELAECRAMGRAAQDTVASSVASPASAADIRNHIKIVTNLEKLVDDLRRQIHVVAPVRANELQQQNSDLQRVMLRMLADLAAAKNVPEDDLRTLYAVPGAKLPAQPNSPGRSVAELEAELLAKNSALLDLRFANETLELRVGRLQRHLDDLMAVGGSRGTVVTQRSRQNQVESLEAVVANLQLVIQALQKENANLKERAAFSARYPDVLREVKRLRQREKELQTQLAQLATRAGRPTTRLGGGVGGEQSVPTAASAAQRVKLEERLVAAQASADAYHVELEELRANLERQLERRRVEEQEGLTGQRPAQPPVDAASDDGGSGGLPRLDSSRGRPAQAGGGSVPPPLPPAPFAASAGAHSGPHVGMRHHHISRR